MNSIHKGICQLLFVPLTLLVMVAGSVRVNAQTPSPLPPTPAATTLSTDSSFTEIFSQPVNLSRSGAASQPRVFVSPDGVTQVFWIDKFDGLMTAIHNGSSWSDPIPAPVSSFTGTFGFQEKPMTEMPFLISDRFGNLHAFYYGEENPLTKLPPLIYSRLRLGSYLWSGPQVIAETAVKFDVAASPNGDLDLVYFRNLHSPVLPAGIYHKLLRAGLPNWGDPNLVFPSIYYRLITPENAWIKTLQDSFGKVHIVWEDPFNELGYYTSSGDNGNSWSPPEILQFNGGQAVHPRLAYLGDNTFRIWESQLELCSIIQQTTRPLSVLSSAPQATPAALGEPDIWSDPDFAYQKLAACPVGDSFYPSDDDHFLFWLWGGGTTDLKLASFDAQRNVWTEPLSLNPVFHHPDRDDTLLLGDLHTALSPEHIAITGIETGKGEVWASFTTVSPADLIQSPVSPWSSPLVISPPEKVSQKNTPVEGPIIRMDPGGSAHIIWIQGSPNRNSNSELNYTRWDGTALSSPTEIFSSDSNTSYLSPEFLIDNQGILHLSWVTEPAGFINYSRAVPDQALTAGGWSPVQELAVEGVPRDLQLREDPSGIFYLLYAVPINENRGIHLIKSVDGGQTWSQATKVFDAIAAGWDKIASPSLLITPDGTLHVAWLQSSSSENAPPQGIFYSASSDGGSTWSDAIKVEGAGYSYPQLALYRDQVHLFYLKESDRSIWHRSAAAAQPGEVIQAFGSPVAVPGWQGMAAPFGLTSDGLPGSTNDVPSTLYLVGLHQPTGELYYSTWNGQTWSRRETLDPNYLLRGIDFQPSAQKSQALSASTRPQGGDLAVAWLLDSLVDQNGSQVALPALLFINRTLPELDVPEIPPPVRTPELPTPTPTLEPTTIPTATPVFPTTAPADQPAIPPVALAGVVGGIVIIVLFAWRLLIARKHP